MLIETLSTFPHMYDSVMGESMMKLGCYLFIAVVGLIGFMNMANTMIMNITTKKQEYGVLQYCHFDNFVLLTSSRLDGDYVPIPT